MESVINSQNKSFNIPSDDLFKFSLDIDTLWKSLLLFTANLAAHWQALGGGIIWDDDAHITRTGLRSLSGLWDIWTKLGATQQYYPLVHSFFWFEQSIWGDSAFYYHLTNIILHSIVSLLLVFTLKKLEIRGSWVAGFIFALHPVHVESVAWITEQKNTLSAIFYLAAAYYYIKFDTEKLNKLYYIASFLFICALLSKTVTATLPAALLVVFWWKRGKLSFKNDIIYLIPWLLIGALGGYFTAWVEKTLIGAQGPDYQNAVILNPITRCLLAGHVIWFYLSKLLLPVNLVFIYEHWTLDAANPFDYTYLIVLLIFVFLLCKHALRKNINGNTSINNRAPLAGFLFFSGTLFPVLGFANVYPFMFSYVADHFQYLASIGIIVPAASFITIYLEKLTADDKGSFSAIGGVILSILGFLSWNQCSMYKDAETLYRITIDRNSSCWMAHNNLGAILLGKNNIPEASKHFEEALKIRPMYPDAQSNLCSVLIRTGKIQEAIEHGIIAVKLRPTAENHNNLAIALYNVGRISEAIEHYLAALKINPNYVEVLNNLGNAYLKIGNENKAIECYVVAIKNNPNFADAWSNYGVVLANQRKFAEAIKADEQAVRLRLNSALYHANLATAYFNIGRQSDALIQFQNSLQLDPNNAEIWYNVGNILIGQGRYSDAEIPYMNALKLTPNNIGAENNLAAVYFKLGRVTDAILHYQIAIKNNPNYPEAHNNLGVALVANKLLNDGISEYNKAVSLNPKYADAYNNLGLAYSNNNNFGEAIKYFKLCLDIDGKNIQYLANMKHAQEMLKSK